MAFVTEEPIKQKQEKQRFQPIEPIHEAMPRGSNIYAKAEVGQIKNVENYNQLSELLFKNTVLLACKG